MYPEHSKLKLISEESEKIGNFLEWLKSKEIILCRSHIHTDRCYNESLDRLCGLCVGEYFPDSLGIEEILAMYFEIDLKKLSLEKDEMLKEIRKPRNT